VLKKQDIPLVIFSTYDIFYSRSKQRLFKKGSNRNMKLASASAEAWAPVKKP